MLTFTEDFAYCMAHHLPDFPEGHKCRNLHGHTCVLGVKIVVPEGCIIDHADLRAVVGPIVKQLCHSENDSPINDIAPELADGTTEAQLRWFWPQIAAAVATIGSRDAGHARLIELEHAEASAPGGLLHWHRKSRDEPPASLGAAVE